MTTYVTFGSKHHHYIKGKEFHHNTVAVIPSNTWQEGRQKAFKLFGIYFAFEYFNESWTSGEYYADDAYIEIDTALPDGTEML